MFAQKVNLGQTGFVTGIEPDMHSLCSIGQTCSDNRWCACCRQSKCLLQCKVGERILEKVFAAFCSTKTSILVPFLRCRSCLGFVCCDLEKEDCICKVLVANVDILTRIVVDQHQKGNLFTLFMHSPLTAFCYICNIVDIPVAMWDKCQAQIDKFIAEASKLFTRSRSLGELQAFGHRTTANVETRARHSRCRQKG